MVVTYITSEKIMLQSIYYKSFSYQHLNEQATLLISIHNVKNGFYWLNWWLTIEHNEYYKQAFIGDIRNTKICKLATAVQRHLHEWSLKIEQILQPGW